MGFGSRTKFAIASWLLAIIAAACGGGKDHVGSVVTPAREAEVTPPAAVIVQSQFYDSTPKPTPDLVATVTANERQIRALTEENAVLSGEVAVMLAQALTPTVTPSPPTPTPRATTATPTPAVEKIMPYSLSTLPTFPAKGLTVRIVGLETIIDEGSLIPTPSKVTERSWVYRIMPITDQGRVYPSGGDAATIFGRLSHYRWMAERHSSYPIITEMSPPSGPMTSHTLPMLFGNVKKVEAFVVGLSTNVNLPLHEIEITYPRGQKYTAYMPAVTAGYWEFVLGKDGSSFLLSAGSLMPNPPLGQVNLTIDHVLTPDYVARAAPTSNLKQSSGILLCRNFNWETRRLTNCVTVIPALSLPP